MLAAMVCVGAEQHIVLPPGFESVEASVNNTCPIGSVGGGTHQVLYSTQSMSSVPQGAFITGFQLRQDNNFGFLPWPREAATIANYRVIMGTSARSPAGFSSTFAENILEPRLVRSGVLALAKSVYPGSFPIGGTVPKGWGPVILLDEPYRYDGGPLVIEFRNGGVPSSAGQTSGDASTNSTAAAGGGNSTSPDATTSNGASVVVVRLTYVVSSCPADLNADGMVDDADFPLFVAAYNILDCADPTMAAGCPSDFNADALVDDADFVVFVMAYNELVCP